jgi:ElaB/YqjD/DUF883 family membrane-anchored ribosome-binding protein
VKRSFRNQFDSLSDLIKKNVETVEDLIQQSQGLSKIAEGLSQQEESQLVDIRESIENIQQDMSKNIGKLVEQTEQLFRTYGELIDKYYKD